MWHKHGAFKGSVISVMELKWVWASGLDVADVKMKPCMCGHFLTSLPGSPAGPVSPGGPTGPGGPRSPPEPGAPCFPGSPWEENRGLIQLCWFTFLQSLELKCSVLSLWHPSEWLLQIYLTVYEQMLPADAISVQMEKIILVAKLFIGITV